MNDPEQPELFNKVPCEEDKYAVMEELRRQLQPRIDAFRSSEKNHRRKLKDYRPMKKLPIAGIVSLSLIAALCLGATYQLSFDPSPTLGVTYRVYSSTNSVNWKFERATTNTTLTLSNMPPSVMAFGVSSTNANGESAKVTAEVIFAPTNLKIVEQ